VLLIFSAAALVASKTFEQLSDLVLNLPAYRQNLHDKLEGFRQSDSRALKELEKTVAEVREELQSTSAKANEAAQSRAGLARAEPPVPVRLVANPTGPLDALQMAFFTLAEPLAQAGFVVVLVIFMLASREDLRDRVIRLAGTGRITLTTRTLDELSTRISRYLLDSAIVNGGFGLTIGCGLYAIGVHYALLWGFLGGMLRFVPYLGPIAGSLMPIGMAIIQFPSWTQPALAIGLFIVVELITNNVIEPLVYGKTGGVSTVALLLAAIFWSWVWGPIGLMLSVPMTVVLAVLGKYVTALEPLWILLGDHAALAPHVRLYQRLLAGDSEEAAEVVEEFSREHAPIEVYDQLFIPTLALLKRDRQRGQISETLAHSVHAMSQQLLEEYVEDNAPAAEPAAETNGARHLTVIGAPAAEAGDELALEMLRRVVTADVELKIVPLVTLASELIELVAQRTPQAVCISALGPGGTGQTRYLCKRLRQRFPNIRVIVGRWGFEGEVARTAANLQSRGANQIVTSLAEAVDVLARTQVLEVAAAGAPAA
jgi:predicted PurR-regulated permease PerM